MADSKHKRTLGKIEIGHLGAPPFIAGTDAVLSSSGIGPLNLLDEDEFENASSRSLWKFFDGSEVNNWEFGTAEAYSGSYSLYISEDGGTSSDYTETNTAIVFVTRSLNFPAGAVNATMSFDWKCNGEGRYDHADVHLKGEKVPIVGTSLPDAGRYNTADMSENTTWHREYFPITESVDGKSLRFIMQWKNDSSVGGDPGFSFDNLQVTYHSGSDTIVTPAVPEVNNNTSPITGSVYIDNNSGSFYVNMTKAGAIENTVINHWMPVSSTQYGGVFQPAQSSLDIALTLNVWVDIASTGSWTPMSSSAHISCSTSEITVLPGGAGWYQVDYQGAYQDFSADDRYEVGISVNGATPTGGSHCKTYFYDFDEYDGWSGMCVLELQDNDYVRLNLRNVDATNPVGVYQAKYQIKKVADPINISS